MTVLKNGMYLSPEGGFKKGDIVIRGSKIEAIADSYNTASEDDVTDASGLAVIPGLIDIHTHGALGYDVSTDSAQNILKLSHFYAENGVTSFMPTTMTDTDENIKKAIENIRTAAGLPGTGASIVGVHAEGPYISHKYKGCHKADLIRPPKKGDARRLREMLGASLKLRITAAPELPGMTEFIRNAKETGAYISLGHSDADEHTALEAVKAGANSFTHLFNAMRGIHHREPAIAGAALLSDAFTEIICDGVHINPDIVKIAYKLKGPDRMILVTDSMPATGLDDCDLIFGGMKVHVKNKTARTEDGALAGSTLLLRQAVDNMVRFTGASFEQAVRMATINPARAIGIDGFTGSLTPGKYADLTVIDSSHDVIMTYCRGRKVYSSR